MNLNDLPRAALQRLLTQEHRALRLRFGGFVGEALDGVLLPQQLQAEEGVCEGATLHLDCLTTDAALDVQALLGLPLEVSLDTDGGAPRRWCLVVTRASLGGCDGALTAVQLTARDVLAVMEQRRGNRIFLDRSVPEIARTVLAGWRESSAALARCFEVRLLLDESRYPRRACTLQLHQSDAAFVRALLAREGISWFVRPLPGDDERAAPRQELVLFDDAMRLPPNAAGPLRWHHSAGVEPRDTIELLALSHTLVPGSVRRASWDHETARVDVAQAAGAVDQGEDGNALAAALRDARIELPHAGDDPRDHERLARVALRRHAAAAQCLHGVGGVRAQAVGEYNRIDGHPRLDEAAGGDERRRKFVTVALRHWARSNLPKALDERAQALLRASSAQVASWTPWTPALGDAARRYVNRFSAVRCDAPLAPAWDPRLELPALPLMTATVVGVPGLPVWCDELGRVKVQFHGLEPDAHAHALGAGTNGNAGDSAWVRVNGLWCGPGFGVAFPLRPGMEVSIGFEMGDPSRPVIMGSRHHAANPPPRFDGLGALQSVVKQLGALADTHHAGGSDVQRLRHLGQLLRDWERGSNVAPNAGGGGAPVVAVSAAAGAALASQDNLLLGAQTHIDAVSVGHTQVTAGGQLRQRAAQGVSTFAQQGGITAVAAHGGVSVQAHEGDVDVLAAHTLRLTAGVKLVLQAPEVEIVSQGAATRWGGGSICEQARGAYVIRSATFSHGGAGDGVPEGVKVPGSDLKFDQQVLMRWSGTNEPMAHQRYRVRTASGAVFEGVTDANELTQRFPLSEPYETYCVEPLQD